MTMYEDACHGWQGEPVLADTYHVAPYLAMAAPIVAIFILLIGVM